jgi:hypothetical protein
MMAAENLAEDDANVFWRNISNGLPRNRAVLNNDGQASAWTQLPYHLTSAIGDGLKLVDVNGNILAEVNSADFEGEAATAGADTSTLTSPRRVTSKTITSSSA